MRKSLVGERFGRLLVVSYAGSNGKRSLWECQCDCGNSVIRHTGLLSARNTKSCGCLKRDNKRGNPTHGKAKTPEWKSWSGMKGRCYNPRCQEYQYYGARGIIVCERWLGPNGFVNFFADMGEKPSAKHSLDRIDVNGNYEPTNCRWATAEQQNRNKRDNRIIDFNGRRATIAEWAEDAGLPVSTLLNRLAADWPFEKAITTPSFGNLMEHVNDRPTNRRIEYDGRTMTLAQWARETGIQHSTILRRIRLGWSIADALTTPVRKLKGVNC